jgi:hypothetical protein
MHLHVDRLRVGRGVAEALHHQVGAEAQAGQVLQLVACHRAGGVLRADRGHARLAVGARAHALAFRQAAGASDHLLRQREALLRVGRALRQAEQRRRRQAQRLARLGGQAAADDQRDAAAGTHLVEQHVALDLELGDHLAVLQRLAFVRAQLDDVAHLHLVHVELDRQRAGVFHRVVEDRGDLAAQADAAEALVRHERDVLAGEPQHRVGGRLAARAGADDVADVGHQVALRTQRLEELDRAALALFLGHDARARVLQHRQRVQRDVRAAPGVGGRRQVVGVGLAADLEDRHGQALRHLGAAGEPLGIGPALQHRLRMGIALVGQRLDVVELVEHQQRLLQALGRDRADRGVLQQLDQRADVVAAQHRAEQLGRLDAVDQRAACLAAVRDGGQERGLHLGGVVDAGRHAVCQQLDQEGFLALRRRLQQLDQLGGLLRGQGQGRDAEGGAFGDVLAVGVQHVRLG